MESGRKTSWVQTGVFVRSRKPAHLPLHWCEPEGGCWWDLQPCEPLRTILMVLLLLLACPRGSRVRDTTSSSLSGFGVRHRPCLLQQPFCCIIVMKWKGGLRHFPVPGALCSRISAPCRWPAEAWLWHQTLHTVVWCMSMTSQLLPRKKKRVGEWQVWGKGGLLLHILLLPQFVLHIFLQIFSSKLWEWFPETWRLQRGFLCCTSWARYP